MRFSPFSTALSSFSHYWRTNLLLAMGIAAATAVLTGALVVGDSMRSSLKELALDRLGDIDEMVVADGFFRRLLATEISNTETFGNHYDQAEAVILFPSSTAEIGDEFADQDSHGLRRASSVAAFGISDSFWQLGSDSLNAKTIEGRQVIINQALASMLNVDNNTKSAEPLTLRIPKPGQLPSDSALGKKSALIDSLVELEIVQILPNESVARFGLRPSQLDSPNIFLPIDLLNDALVASGLGYKSGPQANAVLLSGKATLPPSEKDSNELFSALSPSLVDLGVSVRHVIQKKTDAEIAAFQYYGVSSDRLVLPPEIVSVVQNAFPNSQPVFTYLANDIATAGAESGIPFSTVAAIDFDSRFPLVDVEGQPIQSIGDDEIVVNEWVANDQGLKVGDILVIKYFEPETTHGNEIEKQVQFKVAAIAKLSEPDSAFSIKGNDVTPAKFDSQFPTLANDPDLVPEVPGLTDAESIEKWDLPFPTEGIREVDNDYWDYYRTTPKAFVSLKRGQALWGSRFGNVTSLRIPVAVGNVDDVRAKLQLQLKTENTKPGFSLIPVKRNAIDSSSGATPFDVLFLALSMFVIAAALMLVSLLLRLTLNRRASEMGTLLAVGFNQKSLSRLLITELLLVAIVGTVVGLVLGIGYAAIMIFGLKTWWLGAIASPILNLKISPVILVIGAIVGLLICLLTILFTIRSSRNRSISNLLAGEMDTASATLSSTRAWYRLVVALLLVAAVGLSIVATRLGGEPQAGAFMGAGFLVLAALLLIARTVLGQQPLSPALTEGRAPARGRHMTTTSNTLSLSRLAAISGKRNPLRSTLTIALVAVASFLIIAVSSFRLSPTDEGTGGFDLIASSDQPIYQPLGELQGSNLTAYSLRLKAGDDASCTNLYQSSQPQVLGVSQEFVESFNNSDSHFRWATTTANENESANPWQMLNRVEDDGAIPVVIDKNTANYSLKIFSVGGDYIVNFDSGEQVTFRVVGFLENSILQGSLIISEDRFVKAFPLVPGYRQFLIRSNDGSKNAEALASDLESRFGDEGFDAEMARDKLARYQRVQNTYISTFQTLGGLGLLLGTFGLAAVQIRSVFERQGELGLMRSVGWSRAQLSRMVLLENIWLLLAGLAIGIFAALVTTIPHYFIGGAAIPWVDLIALLAIILLFGIAAAWLASRIISKLPLIESLRVTQ